MDEFPVLETERLILREFRESDAQAVFDIFSQECVSRYVNSETMQSIAEAEDKVQSRMRLFKDGHGVRWAVTLKEQGDTVIGSCGFYLLNRDWFSCETGYELHPCYWRQGIMTEALTTILDFGYGDSFFFPLNRVQALTYLDSAPSIGLLKKLGFKDEGVRRETAYWKGRFHDLRCFSLLRREWMARRQGISLWKR